MDNYKRIGKKRIRRKEVIKTNWRAIYGVHDYDNIFCECTKGMVHFDVWHDDESFELHFTFKDTLVSVVSEITSTIVKFEG